MGKHPWKTWELVLEEHPYLFIVGMTILGAAYYPSTAMVLNIMLAFLITSPLILIAKKYFAVARWNVNTANDYRYPSYHSGIAASLSVTVLSHHAAMGAWFIIMAMFAGYARVTSGKHTSHEILAGFLLGAMVGVLAAILFRFMEGVL